MANMVYLTMQVQAPNESELLSFIKDQTDTTLETLKQDNKTEFKFILEEDCGPSVDNYSLTDNTLIFQFQTKWSPPSIQLREISQKYKNFTIEVDAYEEFNHFSYTLSSGPNHFNENFKKTSLEEIQEYDDKLYEFNELIQKLSDLSDETYEDVLVHVTRNRTNKKELENKYTFIKENLSNLHGHILDDVYEIVKNPYRRFVTEAEDDDDEMDEDWM